MGHGCGVKRALTGLALSVLIVASPAGAAEPPARFVIEPSCVDDTSKPFDAGEMQRLAAGMPPRLMSVCTVSFHEEPGFFTYRCRKDGNHHSNASFQFKFTQQAKFSVAGLFLPKEAEGMRVLRGPDGGIQQVVTMKNCFFISQDKDLIASERYLAYDCETTPEGWMKVLPGAVCASRSELREQAPDPAKGIRTFEIKVLGEKKGTLIFVLEFQETKGRVQVASHNYGGDKPSPENLTSQGTLQRVFWKEGPGYRQITKNEVREPDGTLRITEHTITNWRVDKQGYRHLVDTQKLVAPPERDADDPVH